MTQNKMFHIQGLKSTKAVELLVKNTKSNSSYLQESNFNIAVWKAILRAVMLLQISVLTPLLSVQVNKALCHVSIS